MIDSLVGSEQRRVARELVSEAGSPFEGEHVMVPLLYNITVSGHADRTDADAALIGRWIIYGVGDHITGEQYLTTEEARAAFMRGEYERGECE